MKNKDFFPGQRWPKRRESRKKCVVLWCSKKHQFHFRRTDKKIGKLPPIRQVPSTTEGNFKLSLRKRENWGARKAKPRNDEWNTRLGVILREVHDLRVNSGTALSLRYLLCMPARSRQSLVIRPYVCVPSPARRRCLSEWKFHSFVLLSAAWHKKILYVGEN